MILRTIYTIVFLISINGLFAQSNKKSTKASRATSPIVVDGILNETDWKNAVSGTDFIQFEPYNGKSSKYQSEVQILYSDYAIYIGAKLFDTYPDSIMNQLSKRDQIGQSDFFGITIDPFNDGLTGYTFIVTPANVQFDARQSNFEDTSWDAVWVSKSKINEQGWVVEMEIPYSELRFPQKEVQVWGLNMVRNVQRTREKSFWNRFDNSIDGYLKQAGVLNGIENVEPPIRLSLTPYLSGYLLNTTETNGIEYDFKGGLDLKYGINESYTLDMMLIPDFGQVESDDKILNISAFETYYDEKRPFFTEGTELFDKGEIFYSRRIGSIKSDNYDGNFELYEHEKISSSPSQTSLINVTKLSGKGQNGLAIGFLNGVSANSELTITDTLTGKKRNELLQPNTNYNVLVLDKSLKNNSFISLTNTNYLQPTFNYQSNVTATEMRFETKEGKYALEALGGLSYINDTNHIDSTGYKYEVELEKISGNFRFSVEQSLATKSFNQNDMGFLPKTDELETEIGVRYNIYEPFWHVLHWYNQFNVAQFTLFSDRKRIGEMASINTFTTFKNYLSIGLNAEATIGGYNDYYEPRVDGRVLKMPGFSGISAFISPDYRKKFVIDANVGYFKAYNDEMWSMHAGIEPIIRFNDKMNMNLRINYVADRNEIGFADKTDNNDTIYIGRRNVYTITNSLNINYNFNSDMALSFRGRHYWRGIKYLSFHTLNLDGSLKPDKSYSTTDINSNYFTIDFIYSWRFAPGSELSVVWKNAIENDTEHAILNYYDNISNLLSFDQQNSISIRVLYYIDYFKVSRKWK